MKHWAREYRYVIAIGSIVFIAFCLAVVAQFFKETNCVAKWAFYFFSEWAMALSAAVMLLLAAAAFWAIMDNRHGRRVDRKQRLQNAIINWAVDARKALFVPWFERQTVVEENMREKLEAIAAVSSIVKANATAARHTGNVLRFNMTIAPSPSDSICRVAFPPLCPGSIRRLLAYLLPVCLDQ